MSFIDYPIRYTSGEVSGDKFAVTQTAPLTLQVAGGTIWEQQTGNSYTLELPQSMVLTPDPLKTIDFFLGIVTDGVVTDLWADVVILKNQFARRGSPPAGFRLLADIAWGVVGPGETTLDNVPMARRIYL